MEFQRFDWEEKIRDCYDPRKLYLMTEELAKLKQQGIVGDCAWEELMSVIREKIGGIEAARKQLQSA